MTMSKRSASDRSTSALSPGGVVVDIDRLDAHAADSHGRQQQIEVGHDVTLSELLATVVEPFIQKAPRGTWVCRGRFREGWLDFADVVTSGPPDRLGAHLLVDDAALATLLDTTQSQFQVACRSI
ncbi:hypothetical protein ACFVTX_04995 [Agromyces sp. NPDC058136]|uniref:hypothetical protein n=1 Tax=Agromyces sp. NPDC058136 TaxID=3346354 RepID=UPI0036DCA39B